MDRLESISQLPMEDTIWNVSLYCEYSNEDSDDSNSEETKHEYLQVVDKKGYTVGSSAVLKSDVVKWETILKLLGKCMLSPLTWIPRRPKTIQLVDVVTDRNHLAFLLSEIGIFMPGQSVTRGQHQDILWRSCTVCSRRGSNDMFSLCPDCAAMFYCSKKCQENDADHQKWCSKVGEIMATSDHLAEYPFEFSNLTTQINFDDRNYSKFLHDLGILGHGYWRREGIDGTTVLPRFGCLPAQTFAYGLPEEECILEGPPSRPLRSLLPNWEDYYSWRGLSAHSPVAILLQFPLTIYSILQKFLSSNMDKTSLCVHIVGAEKEADIFPVFFELAYLLPNIQLQLHFVGPLLSKKIDNQVVDFDNIRIVAHKGKWDEVEIESPDVVIGLNAGIGAYTSWTNTLEKLRDQAIPAFFTDYCQLSYELARKGIEDHGIGTLSELTLNPFRCPVRKFCEEHCMPWYSNGFIFQLVYTCS